MNRLLALIFLAGIPLFAQDSAAPAKTARYYVAFLRPDPSRLPLGKTDSDRIQFAHMASIRKMEDAGVLIVAGPVDDTPATVSSILVFALDSLEAAQAVAAQDPTVAEHRNTVDVHVWNGPPALGEQYYEDRQLDPDAPVNMQIHPLCIIFRGPDWDRKENKRDALLAAHERYIARLRALGKLGAAGAIEPPDDLLGLVMFRPPSLEDAQRLLDKDPAVEAGVLHVEYHRWWSPDHVLPW
jgi:uncharacterized protein YciI